MADFSIGLSALTASQYLLDIYGNNITNADTPGFHRQNPILADRSPTLHDHHAMRSQGKPFRARTQSRRRAIRAPARHYCRGGMPLC